MIPTFPLAALTKSAAHSLHPDTLGWLREHDPLPVVGWSDQVIDALGRSNARGRQGRGRKSDAPLQQSARHSNDGYTGPFFCRSDPDRSQQIVRRLRFSEFWAAGSGSEWSTVMRILDSIATPRLYLSAALTSALATYPYYDFVNFYLRL